MKHKKVLLMILDGWGIGANSSSNAIKTAKTPNLDCYFSNYPNSKLQASGLSVGLPEGIMGNSEVGHLNLGAGRIIFQDLVKINKACQDGTLGKNKNLLEAFSLAKKNKVSLHFIGLVSDGGVHSMNTHLYKLCDLAGKKGLERVFVHAISDGRDTDPKSGLGFIKDLEKHLAKSTGVIASLIGRYYTMDRDNHFERIKEGYDLMVKGIGKKTRNIQKSIQESYQADITDEFIKPIIAVDKKGEPIGLIKKGDVVICFNFRTERLREITDALTQKNFPKYNLKKIPLRYYTMTKYDDLKGVKVLFEKDNIKNSLGEIVSKNNLKQLRIAETEKYAHVTYFFSGGRKEEFRNEKRILINSPRVATYDLMPEMSAPLITKALIKELARKDLSFVCLNFANGDMVGHTGVFKAIIKAIEVINACVGQIVEMARKNNFDILIVADHGNAEVARNKNGSANTAHSLNPVPCLLISDDYEKIKNGVLADVAPTVLKIMGLKVPKEMTGKVLV